MRKKAINKPLTIAVMIMAVLTVSCGKSGSQESASDSLRVANEVSDTLPMSQDAFLGDEGIVKPQKLADIQPLPFGVGHRIRVANIGSLAMVFNDSNFTQLAAAQRLGIEPVTDLSSAYFTRRPLVKVTDCEYYKIDSLRHSLPYLVPEAATLLADIGKAFNDSLEARGGDSHLIKVTSLLRTPESVSRLRRVNVNATDSSTHQYATTFDISYVNFHCTDSSRMIYQGDLKNLLAEVLYNLRGEGRCLVKFERKTGCFHITALR